MLYVLGFTVTWYTDIAAHIVLGRGLSNPAFRDLALHPRTNHPRNPHPRQSNVLPNITGRISVQHIRLRRARIGNALSDGKASSVYGWQSAGEGCEATDSVAFVGGKHERR